MKIAVLGGGTAGFIAAAHFTRHLPQAELVHVFDSRIPTIGVGEGTTPRFPMWFEEVTGLGFPHLAERCGATLKRGSRFEGWGANGADFVHRFQPARLVGYHFDAAAVVEVLGEHVRATRIDARVEALQTSEDAVRVRLDDDRTLLCDYVFDARGFPTNGAAGVDDLIRLDWIPTGRAMVRRLAPQASETVTRVVARPHGWMFVIPLRDWISCGYVFNPHISSDAEVAADHTAFLHEQGVVVWEERVAPSFPNFIRRKMFDGRVFWAGNAALFIEPLEATTIGHAIGQVRWATRWIKEEGRGRRAEPDEIDVFNSTMVTLGCRDSLFIAWHYACGSRWDTPFWQHARGGIERARNHPVARSHLEAMAKFIEAGRPLPGQVLSACEDQGQWERDVLPLLRLHRPFGNFSELNFAQVGHGIGYYHADAHGPALPAQ
jgi:2-polyprenyl-6-methoxyphenol hydroxylase-like FAD-dependent oxidoreductase